MRTEVLHQKKEWSSILPTPGIIAKQTSPQNNPLNRKPNPLPFPEDNLVDYQNLKNKTSLKRTNSSPKCANTKTMELRSQVLPNQNPFNNNRSPFNFHNMRNLRTLKMKKMIQLRCLTDLLSSASCHSNLSNFTNLNNRSN